MTIPLLRLHSLWPMIEKIRPSPPQNTSDSTNPAIAMPDVRVCMMIGIPGGMPIGGAGGRTAPSVKLLPHVEQNAAAGEAMAPHFGHIIGRHHAAGSGVGSIQIVEGRDPNGIRQNPGVSMGRATGR